MKLVYTLTGHGWAEAVVSNPDYNASMRVSYLSDALADLSNAVITILDGADEARASFDDEPGEYRWVFRKTGAAAYRLKILRFEELWSNEPDCKGVLIFEEHGTALEYGLVVRDVLADIYHRIGRKRYRRLWIEYPFPTRELIELRKRIPKGLAFPEQA